eukprot:g33729.t1
MGKSFKGQLIRVQDQQVPMRKKDKDGKIQESWMMRDVKEDMDDGKIREGYIHILRHVDIKEGEMMLGILKNNKVEKSPGLDRINPRILRE